jgi:CRP-like cAMP-binding protein
VVTSSPRQVAAHLAALLGIALVMAGALMRTILPLRWLAVGSNFGLLAYGALHPSPITLAISAALLPVNVWRAVEVTRLTRRVSRAGVAAEMAALWLRPYMKTHALKAGQTLFSRGDVADRLYMLVQGRMELAGIGKALEPGKVFGEIALFSPERKRTQTVQCVSDCIVLEIDESTVRQLCVQSPEFGLHLIELVAGRLHEDIARAAKPVPLDTDRPAASA